MAGPPKHPGAVVTLVTITHVGEPKPWTGQHGPMVDYWLTLEGEDKQAILTQKPETAPPAVGPVDLNLIQHPRFPDKFKATKPQQGGGSGGGGRPRDPAEQRSIAMQHAQKCAVEALKLAAAHGDYRPPAAADVVEQVKLIASGLFHQIEEVAK